MEAVLPTMQGKAYIKNRDPTYSKDIYQYSDQRKKQNNLSFHQKENIENIHSGSTFGQSQGKKSGSRPSSSLSFSASIDTSSDSQDFRFIHEDDRFKTLIKMCAEDRGVDASFVEKDYYISHALWCLRKKGLDIQIKGGVSLAKGYGALNRLSEDVDIVVRPNSAHASYLQDIVQQLSQMDMKSKSQVRDRARLWVKFANIVKKGLSGFNVVIGTKNSPFYDPRWTYMVMQANYESLYPILDENLTKPEVMIEVSMGSEEPLEAIPMRLTSFLHAFLERKHLLHQFKRNIPTVLCTHPMITLLQKISDGIVNRFHRPLSEECPMLPFASGLRGKVPPFDPRIIRHYEDAAIMILNISKCHPLSKPAEYMKLYTELMERRMVRRKVELGTLIHSDESIALLHKDQAKIDALKLCQQQRLCLHYDRKDNALVRSPPTLEHCSAIIHEWLVSVGL